MALTITDVDVCAPHRAKISYLTRREARDVAKQMNAFGIGGAKEAYQCRGCGVFLVGTILPPHVKAKLRRQARLRASSS